MYTQLDPTKISYSTARAILLLSNDKVESKLIHHTARKKLLDSGFAILKDNLLEVNFELLNEHRGLLAGFIEVDTKDVNRKHAEIASITQAMKIVIHFNQEYAQKDLLENKLSITKDDSVTFAVADKVQLAFNLKTDRADHDLKMDGKTFDSQDIHNFESNYEYNRKMKGADIGFDVLDISRIDSIINSEDDFYKKLFYSTYFVKFNANRYKGVEFIQSEMTYNKISNIDFSVSADLLSIMTLRNKSFTELLLSDKKESEQESMQELKMIENNATRSSDDQKKELNSIISNLTSNFSLNG